MTAFEIILDERSEGEEEDEAGTTVPIRPAVIADVALAIIICCYCLLLLLTPDASMPMLCIPTCEYAARPYVVAEEEQRSTRQIGHLRERRIHLSRQTAQKTWRQGTVARSGGGDEEPASGSSRRRRAMLRSTRTSTSSLIVCLSSVVGSSIASRGDEVHRRLVTTSTSDAGTPTARLPFGDGGARGTTDPAGDACAS